MITDNAAILGWTGTLATISIGQWNEAIACVCGVVTTIYMITKLINLLRRRKKRHLNIAKAVPRKKKLYAKSSELAWLRNQKDQLRKARKSLLKKAPTADFIRFKAFSC